MEWMPDGERLLIGRRVGNATIVDARTGEETSASIAEPCASICAGHDGSYLLCFMDMEVRRLSLSGETIAVMSLEDLNLPGGPLALRGFCEVSPDGAKLLFVARAKDFYWGKHFAPSTAFVHDFSTGRTVQASPDRLGLARARWLPGANAIAFTAFEKTSENRAVLNRGDRARYDLYRTNVDGSELRAIASDVWGFTVITVMQAQSPFWGPSTKAAPPPVRADAERVDAP